MERRITYRNVNDPHVTIHRKGCSQIKKHGGHHVANQGEYKEHSSYEEARSYAESTGLEKIIDCSFCNPKPEE